MRREGKRAEPKSPKQGHSSCYRPLMERGLFQSQLIDCFLPLSEQLSHIWWWNGGCGRGGIISNPGRQVAGLKEDVGGHGLSSVYLPPTTTNPNSDSPFSPLHLCCLQV